MPVVRNRTPKKETSFEAETPPPAVGPKFASVGILVVALAIVLVAGGAYAAKRTTHRDAASDANVALTEERISELVAKVAAAVEVPADEEPTIATIKDAARLREQNPEFYGDAQDGDRILVWSDKAVLWSTAEERIANLLVIQPPPATDPADAPTVEVRNGTRTAGLAKSVSERLEAEGMTVTEPTSAPRTHERTVIVASDAGTHRAAIEAIRGILSVGTVVDLPEGEAPMNGDVLVILGTDYVK